VLEGTRSGFAALRHLLAWPAMREHTAAIRRTPSCTESARQARWAGRLRNGPPLSDVEAIELLADYGLPSPRSAATAGRDEVLAAAQEIGYPVVLKTGNRDISHKSDVGGVVVGLSEPDALAGAYAEMAGRLGPRALVAEMAPPGVELALGVVADAMLGPVVVVGAGGVLVEVMGDRVVALPPIGQARAGQLLDRLKARRLLDGLRGQTAADLESVAAAVVAMSQLALELGPELRALDVNPLRCTPAGVLALDALVIPTR
jgi:acyl-CoA synthetase (NDP forming)